MARPSLYNHLEMERKGVAAHTPSRQPLPLVPQGNETGTDHCLTPRPAELLVELPVGTLVLHAAVTGKTPATTRAGFQRPRTIRCPSPVTSSKRTSLACPQQGAPEQGIFDGGLMHWAPINNTPDDCSNSRHTRLPVKNLLHA